MARRALASLAWVLLAACSSSTPPGGGHATGRLGVDVAALNLAGVGDVVWDVEVRSGTGHTVWQRRLASSRYGDGAGSASYVGTCDADPAGADNVVRVWVVGLYGAAVGDAGQFAAGATTGSGAVAGAALAFQNPTAAAPLERTVRCVRDADVPVRFDVSLMRPAEQGFFDVAVSFNDIFCSAKLDCCHDSAEGCQDITLLFDEYGARARTFVFAYACTTGPAATGTTALHMNDLKLDCTTPSAGFTTDVAISPAGDPAGNQCEAGFVADCPVFRTPGAGLAPDFFFYQIATFRGTEDLTSGGVSARKTYWNVALGVLDTISNCTLRAEATADDYADDSDGVIGGAIGAGVVYPYLTWEVELGRCTEEGLRFDDTGTVRPRYTSAGATAPTPFAYTYAPPLPPFAHCETPCLNGGVCITPGECACPEGYTGDLCETNIDDCQPNPCQNGGSCTDGVASYTCSCLAGFTGLQCETNIDDCQPNPCQNGGSCTDGVASYTCACPLGYEGHDCETETDECEGVVCLHDGVCVDQLASFTCDCAPGFSGTYCEDYSSPCLPNPCVNGGTCTDLVGDFVCTCPSGYSGPRCELLTCPADTATTAYSDNGNCTCTATETIAATPLYSCSSGTVVGSSCVTSTTYAATAGQRYCRVVNSHNSWGRCDYVAPMPTTQVVAEGSWLGFETFNYSSPCREPVGGGVSWFDYYWIYVGSCTDAATYNSVESKGMLKKAANVNYRQYDPGNYNHRIDTDCGPGRWGNSCYTTQYLPRDSNRVRYPTTVQVGYRFTATATTINQQGLPSATCTGTATTFWNCTGSTAWNTTRTWTFSLDHVAYTCSSGDTLSGTTCTHSVSTPAAVSYSCPAGYSPLGATCVKVTNLAASYCPSSDPCYTDPCGANAVCTTIGDTFACSCPEGTVDVYGDATTCAAARAIAAGDAHACAIMKGAAAGSGELYCWGDNTYGQLGLGDTTARAVPTRVGTLSDWQFIEARSSSTCAIRSGELYCWGYNGERQLGLGSSTANQTTPAHVGTETSWDQVSLGSIAGCGHRTDGTIWCWGATSDGVLGTTPTSAGTPTQVGAYTDWVLVRTGHHHPCGIRGTAAGGTLWCWGYNGFGNLGNGVSGSTGTPTQVLGVLPVNGWTSVAPARENWTCGVHAGHAYCWGGDYGGNLGIGVTGGVNSPTEVAGAGANWLTLRTGFKHACGRRSGDLYCWGNNGSGQLGVGTTSNSYSPLRVGTETTWSAVAPGMEHTCGLLDGQPYCWGKDSSGQLGNGAASTANLTVPGPADFTTVLRAISLASGNSHSCAVVGDTGTTGALYCWGANGSGQLGLGDTTTRTSPVKVGAFTDWTFVEARGDNTCAIRAGRLYCWGANAEGQLGLGNTTQRTAPVQVGSATDWATVSLGSIAGCGRRTGGTIYCWGSTDNGVLGTSPASFGVPTQVGTDTDWVLVRTGHHHTCGIRGSAAGGTLWCWGYNGFGNLGTGDGTSSSVPRQSGGGWGTWTSVAPARENWTCGVAEGRAYCFGGNYGGNLGIGPTSGVNEPYEVTGGGELWTEVRTGITHACGLEHGILSCWGVNGNGQIGNGSNTSVDVPVVTALLGPWALVAPGSTHTCAVRGGHVYCWGNDASGQLGNGAAGSVNVPTLITVGTL